MNSEIKIQSKTAEHRKRCIAAFVHEQTRKGKPTTCRQICAAYKWHHGAVNSLLHLMQGEPTQTTYGKIIIVPRNPHTDSAGVTCRTYAGILHTEKSANQ